MRTAVGTGLGQTFSATTIGMAFVLFGLLRTKALAEVGGPAYFAWFSYLGTVATLSVTFGGLGLPFGFQRQVAIDGRPALSSVDWVLGRSLAATVLAGVALTILLRPPDDAATQTFLSAVAVVVGLAVFELARAVAVPALQAAGLTKQAALTGWGFIAVGVCVVVGPLALFGTGAMPAAAALSAVVVVAGSRAIVRSNADGITTSPDLTKLRNLSRSGYWSVAAGCLLTGGFLLVRWRLLRDVGATAAAEYLAVVALFTLVRTGILSATAALVQAEWASNGEDNYTRAKATVVMVVFASLAVAGVSRIDPLVELLFSSQFELGTGTVTAVGLAAIAEAWVWTAEAPVVVAGRFRAWLVGPSLSLLLTVALLLIVNTEVDSELAGGLTLAGVAARVIAVVIVLERGAQRRRALVLAGPAFAGAAVLTLIALLFG